MLRYMLIIGFALGPCLNVCYAQYVRIKVDLNKIAALGQGPGAAGIPPGGDGPPGGPGGSPGGEGGDGDLGDGGYGQFFPTTKDDKGPEPIWVEVWLPARGVASHQIFDAKTRRPKYVELTHPWGKAYVPLPSTNAFEQLWVDRLYKKRFGNMDDEEKTTGKLLSEADWTLKHGMLKEFVAAMQLLAKRDPQHPGVVAFTKVHADLQKRPKTYDPFAEPILNRFKRQYNLYESEQGHYALLTKQNKTAPQDRLKGEMDPIDRRLTILEKTYQGFFYWFALQGTALPVPQHRQLVILAVTPIEYKSLHDGLRSQPMVSDGFVARRENIMVLSSVPISRAYDLLVKNNRNDWQKLNTNYRKMLKGPPKNMRVTDMVAKLTTMALLQKALEYDTARATTSHQAIRQLLIATDFLPRNVATAEWLRYGLASYFATSQQTPYFTLALPSRMNLMHYEYYREMNKRGKNDENGVILSDQQAWKDMVKIITDQYFHDAARAFKTMPTDLAQRMVAYEKAMDSLKKAQTTAWALTWYLMKEKSARQGLLTYANELKKLPRDLEFEASVLSATFARSFGFSQLPVDPTLRINLAQVKAAVPGWLDDLDRNTSLDLLGMKSFLRAEMFPPKSKGNGLNRN